MSAIKVQSNINVYQYPLKYEHTYDGRRCQNGLRCDSGFEIWQSSDEHSYKGNFFHDCLHGHGTYQWSENKKQNLYDGCFYANNLEGYGLLSYQDGNIFEGLFKNNRRFGPGILTYPDGRQDVGLWIGQDLMRLSCTVKPEWMPRLARNEANKLKLVQFRKLVPIANEVNDPAKVMLKNLDADDELLAKSDLLYDSRIRLPQSKFFNNTAFDTNFFGKLDDFMIDVVNSEDENEENHKFTKVKVTDLLAWNNEAISILFLKHTFRHRNFEPQLSFDITKLFAGDRNSFNQPGDYETVCIAFLEACSDGLMKTVRELMFDYDINPDLCDAKGNSGVMFATARDKLDIIMFLISKGANLDITNDEVLTPLNLALLRYIAVLNNCKVWETAFISDLQDCVDNVNHTEWHPHESTQSLPTAMDMKLCTYVRPKSKSILFLVKSGNFSHLSLSPSNHRGINIESSNAEEEPLSKKLVSEDHRHFQQCYRDCLLSGETQPHLLSTECPYPKIEPLARVSILKVERKRSDSIAERSLSVLVRRKSSFGLHLDVIYNTIITLLDNGANPNFGEVPFPPLLLSLFTKNVNIVRALIFCKADLEIRTRPDQGYLTALHIVATLPPHEPNVNICTVLLENGANPNSRVNPDHWPEEKKIILAGHETENDCGKAPLHMLCMRYDFAEDVDDAVGDMCVELMNYNAYVNSYYLGHTPLSLAVLRGAPYLQVRSLSHLADDITNSRGLLTMAQVLVQGSVPLLTPLLFAMSSDGCEIVLRD